MLVQVSLIIMLKTMLVGEQAFPQRYSLSTLLSAEEKLLSVQGKISIALPTV